jgi:two-component system LytT family response regulator
MKKIRTLIVDDEPLAREGLQSLLADDPEVDIVGSCADGTAALAAIRNEKPDLVFLDIQMPKRNGFEVLAELKPDDRPLIIFATAFDKFAIQAFEQCALDYLLKPFHDGRFAEALARAKRELRRKGSQDMALKMDQLMAYVKQLARNAGPAPAGAPADTADRVVLKTGSDLNFIKTADIIRVESQADFVKVHTTGAAQLVRETMQSLEARVDPKKFFRIHRSSLVNLDHVKKVTPALYGDYTVLLSDGTKLRLSRRKRAKLKELINRLSTPEAG